MTVQPPAIAPATEPVTELRFDVIALGHASPNASPAAVQQQLEAQLKLSAATAQRLLAGKPVVLKRDLPAAAAEVYCERLRRTGLAVELRPVATVIAETNPQLENASPVIAAADNTQALPTSPLEMADLSTLPNLFPATIRLRLLLQTARLLAAPLLYGLLVLLTAVVVVTGAIHFSPLLLTPPLFFSLPVYLLPLLAGLLALAVLLRPLLPVAIRDDSVPLDAVSAAQLKALIEPLCQRLGAHPPANIAVDLGATASIRLQRGRAGWQHGAYDLVIGLPLLQNATLPTLAGSLAAELVLASDPTLMRLHRLITGTRRWLQRSGPSQDGIERALQRLPENTATNLLRRLNRWTQHQLDRLFAGMDRLSSRRAEGTLVDIGDRASIAITAGIAGHGTDNPDTNIVAQRLQTRYRLEHARKLAHSKNSERRIDRRLIDDLSALISFFYAQTDVAHIKKLARQIESGSADQSGCGRPDRDRIASGNLASALELASGATLPGMDSESLGQLCTERYYQNTGGAEGERMPAERLLDEALLDLEQAEAGAAYFNGWLVSARGWRLPEAELLRDMPHTDARLQLNVCVNEVRRLTPDRNRLLSEFKRQHTQLNELLLGQQVLAAQHAFQFRYLKYDGSSLQPLIEQKQFELAKIAEQLATQESIMGGRIALGLKLFGQDSADAESLQRCLNFLGEQEKSLYRLEQDATLLEQLLERQQQRGYTDAIARLCDKVLDATLRLLDKLKDAPTPPDRRYSPLHAFFEGREGENSTDNTAAARRNQHAAAVAARARSVLEGFYTLNEKLSLLAAEQASSVEEAYKIERIRLVNNSAINPSRNAPLDGNIC